MSFIVDRLTDWEYDIVDLLATILAFLILMAVARLTLRLWPYPEEGELRTHGMVVLQGRRAPYEGCTVVGRALGSAEAGEELLVELQPRLPTSNRPYDWAEHADELGLA